MEKNLIITKRKKAKILYEKKGWSIRKIAKHLVAGKDNVSRWIQMTEEELNSDNRGWKKNRLRLHTHSKKEKIKSIREELENEDCFFFGAKVVRENYRHQTGEDISLWFVNATLKEYGLVKSHFKKKKGRSKYMLYPVNTIRKLGKSMMSIDFIGPKYLKGPNNRINFLSCKYIRPNKEGIVKRIEGQTTQQTISTLKQVWQDYFIPEVLKVDNDSAFGANLTHCESVGKLTIFLLNLGVKPLYVAPRNPWNNGEVEGFNSIFSKKFWNKLSFKNEQEVDIKIKDFNFEYEKYSKLISNNPVVKEKIKISDFSQEELENREVCKFKNTEIYFLRIVRRKGEKGSEKEKGFINILGREILLKQDIINLFVFCKLDVKTKELTISLEDDNGMLHKINKIKFEIKNITY